MRTLKFVSRHGAARAGLGRHGPIKLLVSGFGGQEVVPVQEIVGALARLPAYHLSGLREISYAPDPAPTWWSRQIKGEFLQRERRVVIYDMCDRATFQHILFHEIGHFVFFLVINSVLKKRWVTAIFPGSDCISAYGSRNASEDFAETYAAYALADPVLLQLPRKFEFMREAVFGGDPSTLKEGARADSWWV